jgi:hypothetical protein
MLFLPPTLRKLDGLNKQLNRATDVFSVADPFIIAQTPELGDFNGLCCQPHAARLAVQAFTPSAQRIFAR